jgi:hypothetical protein
MLERKKGKGSRVKRYWGLLGNNGNPLNDLWSACCSEDEGGDLKPKMAFQQDHQR